MRDPLTARLAAEIGARGPVGFGRYMEVALYDPDHGFYARGGAGRRGDFLTSPEVGPLFGAVVARALDSWWDDLGRPSTLTFVDAGAGPGTLARAVLAAEPECGDALDYVAVESSAAQRSRHPERATSTGELPERVEVGVIFANELLDNLPFDVYEWSHDAGWHEVRVGWSGDALVEVLEPCDRVDLPLPQGSEPFRVPDQYAARRWLEGAVGALGRGRVVVVDYAVAGYPVEPERHWLRTYRGHDRGGPPLSEPGTQDITADVAVDQLSSVVVPSASSSQRQWLTGHGIDALVEDGRRYWAEHAANPDVAALTARSRVSEAEALLDPAGLGGFTVLEWLVGGAGG